jgi:integrase
VANQFTNPRTGSVVKSKSRGNGEGSVYPVKRKNGVSYACAIDDINGTSKVKTFKTKKEAEKYRTTQYASKLKGVVTTVVHPNMPITDFLLEWVESKYELEITTKDNYRKAIKNWISPHIGKIPLGKLSPRTLDNLFHKISNLAGGSQRVVHTVLKQAFDRAERLGEIPSNPMRFIKRPNKKSREILPIPRDHFEIIYKEASKDPRMHAFIEILGILGPRSGEVLALTWSDFDFEKMTITLKKTLKATNSLDIQVGDRKTHDELTIPFTSKNAKVFLKWKSVESIQRGSYLAQKDLVFPDKNGNFKDLRNARREWQQFLKKLELPHYNLHRLRKTAFSHFAQFASPAILKALSGHKSVSTTMNFYVFTEIDVVRSKLDELEALDSAIGQLIPLDGYRHRREA